MTTFPSLSTTARAPGPAVKRIAGHSVANVSNTNDTGADPLLLEMMTGVRKTLVAPRSLDQEALRQGAAALRKAPSVARAAVTAGPVPIVCFEMPSSLRAADFDVSKLAFVFWGWPTPFGGSLTITAMYKLVGICGRAYIAGNDPALEHFKPGHFVAVFIRNGAPAVAVDVDLCATELLRLEFDDCWTCATEHRALVTDPEARFWWSMRGSAGELGESLARHEQLSIGWVECYGRAVERLAGHLDLFKRDYRWPQGASLPPPFDDWNVLGSETLSADAVLALVKQRIAAGLERFSELLRDNWHDAIHAVMGDHTPVCDVPTMAVAACLMSSEQTDSGRRVPLLRGGTLTHHTILPEGFSPGAALAFWKRIIALPLEWASLATATDVPADLTEPSSVVHAMPRSEDEDAANGAANNLIEEALADRRWTIPPGALLEMTFGPFTHVEFLERPDAVQFVLRTATGEFTAGGISMQVDRRHFWWEGLTFDSEQVEARMPIASALYLMLAAAIRDFLVVEERERVFRTNPAPARLQKANAQDGPRIVYLPRVRYVGRPDIEQCREQLDHQPRESRAHAVRPHLRRAGVASAAQLFVARRYGMEVPKGYTFVRPHERGRKARDVIYRSRSALQCLFQVTGAASAGGRDAWFQFERDVQRVMGVLGFDVEHVSASGRGDRGVDVYATKGADLDAVAWVIQCKAFGSKHKVGPHIARELIGTLAEYPQGTRGMIVTTSAFTTDTIELAKKHGIRLMNGDEFGGLLKEATG